MFPTHEFLDFKCLNINQLFNLNTISAKNRDDAASFNK